MAANYSHVITELSEGFVATASYDTVPVAAAEHSQSKIYGVTWNPVAEGSSLGQAVLKTFCLSLRTYPRIGLLIR